MPTSNPTVKFDISGVPFDVALQIVALLEQAAKENQL